MTRITKNSLYWLLIPLVILSLACSLSPSIPVTGGNGYHFDGLPSQTQENSAIAQYNAISKWDTTDINYYFIYGTDQLPGDNERGLIKQAFDLWAAQAPLHFTEVTNQSDANIVIGWATGDHGDGDPFDGPGDVLAHSSFPNPYDERQLFLHFDDDEQWVDSTSSDVDLVTVAAHEIGHTLGLEHAGAGVMDDHLQPGRRATPDGAAAAWARGDAAWAFARPASRRCRFSSRRRRTAPS